MTAPARPAEPTSTVEGLIALHPRGFGFLTAPDGKGGEISAFVPPPVLNAFLAGDRVRGKVTTAHDGRVSASDIELLERHRTQLLGEVVTRRGARFIAVDREVANTDWPLEGAPADLADGLTVLARIDGKHAAFERALPPGVDHSLERVVVRHALAFGHAPEAEAEVAAVTARPHALVGGRRDLRALPTITVDAPSTRDIDDALSVIPAGPDGALRLLVSIADVSEFVTDGSPLDRDARARGTSAYLARTVLPMLPEALSSEHLSLLPGQDRSCLTAELRIDPEGRVLSVDLYESLIRSVGRVSYDELAAWLDRRESCPAIEPIRPALPWFEAVSARLAVARARRGGVVIDRDETRLVFDEAGEVEGIHVVPSTSAHQLVERCMVAANEAVATWMVERGLPVPLRIQEAPDRETAATLAEAASHFGLAAAFGPSLTPLALAAFDRQIAASQHAPALRNVLRRALGRARYTAARLGHFGLAAPLYLHFTSPIRRYADLAVHRTLKAYLHGRRDLEGHDAEVEALCEHLETRARAAERAENDRRRMLEARLIREQIGGRFLGHVTRIQPFGLRVQLATLHVEATVALDTLADGPWKADLRSGALINAAGKRLALGQELVVEVKGVDEVAGRIEAAPVAR